MQQHWTAVWPKGSSQIFLSTTEHRHQPGPGPSEFRPGQPSAGQTCSRRVPTVATSALPHNATETQGSCPQRSGEASEFSHGWLKVLCLLTDESVYRLPHPDTPNIERAYQDFCESLLSTAKPCSLSNVAVARTGFRHGRSAVDQVTMLTQDIEDIF